ncbi:MAG: DUF192 domain-containing protein [Nanoarchaeota archaeon]
MNIKIYLIVIAIMVFLTAYALFFGVNPSESTVIFSDGTKITAELADTPIERQQGLMFRKELCSDCGMLFIFDSEEPVSFWMKNTIIPLDMIFLSEDGKIVNMHENVQPCKADPCPKYSSVEPAKYVIEVNAGFVEANGIEVGDSVQL